MTLKIAGRVVGGLHQRPEYNIPLDKPELALERLPAEVWPQGTSSRAGGACATAVQHRLFP